MSELQNKNTGLNRVMPRISVQYFLNHDLEINEVEKQVELMAYAGIECILLHPRQGLKTPWLSKRWQEIVRSIYRKAVECEVGIAIWDEYPFPSGNAGGLLVSEHPELVGKHLEFFVCPIMAEKHIYKFVNGDDPQELGHLIGGYVVYQGKVMDFSERCGLVDSKEDTRRRIQHVDYQPSIFPYQYPHFRWASLDHRHAMYLEDPERFTGGYVVGVAAYSNLQHRYYAQSDLLNKRTLEKYVEKVHTYYNDLAIEDKCLPYYAFTDEPGPSGSYPWTPSFFDEFQKEHDYELKPLMPHLSFDINDISAQVRIDYRKTQARLFAENYLGTITDWCHNHGIRLGGHLPRLEMIGECDNFPYKFRACSYMDIPTHDPLGSNTCRKDLVLRTIAMKIAVSASRIFKKKDVLTDSFALLPDSASIREIKNSADWQMFAGVNCFAIHNFSYSIAGARKDEAPPSYFYHQPWFSMMKDLTSYMSETCEYLREASFPSEAVVILPDTTVNAFSGSSEEHQKRRLEITETYIAVGGALLDARAAFEFTDERGICEAEMRDGFLNLSSLRFKWILLPDLSYIEEETAVKLEKAVASGIKVVCIGRKPMLVSCRGDKRICAWDATGIKLCSAEDIGNLGFNGFDVRGVTNEAESIWASRVIKDGVEGVYLFNASNRLFKGFVKDSKVAIYPHSGHLIRDISAIDQVAATAGLSVVENGDCKITDRFRVTFNDNQCLLYVWQVISCADFDRGIIWERSPAINLMEERTVERLKADTYYFSRFITGGMIDNLRLVIEPLEDGMLPDIWWNDCKLEGFERTSDFDVLNYSLSIPREYFHKDVPQLNILKVKASEGSFGFCDAPVLVGGFEVSIDHALHGMPRLDPHNGIYDNVLPASWSSFGRMFYSGEALYSFNIEVNEEKSRKNCWMRLGEVETMAEVSVDGALKCRSFSPPYIVCPGRLSKGLHEVEIRVINTLANRLRCQWRKSGLLSGVEVYFSE
jgi:hypothetical protein